MGASGSFSHWHLNSIFLLQKKIIRFVKVSSCLAHTDLIFKDLTIFPLDNLFIDRGRHNAIMFKVEYETNPQISDSTK